jgi:hypothetical protein
MSPDQLRFLPWVFALLIPLALYRRFRRNFGRQPLRPTRMVVRISILLLLGAALAWRRSGSYALEELGGVLLGIALAIWGASRTRFLTEKGQRYYVPHTYTGIAVSLLFVGRLAYRFVQSSSSGAVPGATAPSTMMPAAGPQAMVMSPLTMGIFFVLIGYYVCYYSWLLWKSRHITAADVEPSPASLP